MKNALLLIMALVFGVTLTYAQTNEIDLRLVLNVLNDSDSSIFVDDTENYDFSQDFDLEVYLHYNEDGVNYVLDTDKMLLYNFLKGTEDVDVIDTIEVNIQQDSITVTEMDSVSVMTLDNKLSSDIKWVVYIDEDTITSLNRDDLVDGEIYYLYYRIGHLYNEIDSLIDIKEYTELFIRIVWNTEAVSVKDMIKEAYTLKVYPNPTTNEINLTHKLSQNSVINIYDMTGRTIYQGSDNRIDVSMFPKGTYIIQLYDGVLKTSTKFIKQ